MYLMRFKNPDPSCSIKNIAAILGWSSVQWITQLVSQYLSKGKRFIQRIALSHFKEFELFGGCLLRQLMVFFSG